MTTLTLQEAMDRTAAGIAKATEMGVAMNVAIVDAGGHLLHFSRMEDAWLGSVDIAVKKARTAVLFKMPSAAIGELSQPGGDLYNIEITNGGLVSFSGGLPIVGADGRIVGGVGASGGLISEDAAVAEACLAHQ
ncbi:GlcG/HbpS family heme-binding protein [Streptomyces sp. NBC_01198]|uniref:GlcG/HbpS family heme-binding protein n=1 Tax=Streptomyces sp. NBC_01198 TaxID=2903769 RepID=UPI002E0DD0AD|nr:heme-binding protein [Streptomyces sp. NBC_01198]